MSKDRAVLMVAVIILCLGPQQASSQWAVHDAPAEIQRAAIWVEEALQWGQSLKNQADSIVNEYNLILGQARAYETFIRNLQRIPEGLNVFDTVLAYGAKLNGIMRTAGGISYDLNHASQQFAALYIDVGTVTQGDLPRLKQRFLTARMQTSQVAIQMQAIEQNAADTFARLCALMEGVWTANGALDMAQIHAQQQALQITTLQQTQALQATAERLKAQREAEDVALERIRMQLMEQFVAPLPEYTGTAGALPTYRWVE